MKYLVLIAIFVGATAVVTLGIKLSSETLGILAAAALGIAGGVCGAVPVSIVLVWALVRRTQGNQQTQQPQNQQYPPLIVFSNPGQPPLGLPGATQAPYGSLPAPKRDFKVMPPDDRDWTVE
jgi:hypothetical protein